MNFDRRRMVVRIIVLLFALGVVATTLLCFKGRESDHSSKDYRPGSKLAYAKGIHFTEYRGEKKVYSVSIDTVSVERIRVGPFAIGPLVVGRFSKVVVDLYLDSVDSRVGKANGANDRDLKEELQDFESPISNIRNNLPPELRRVRVIKLKDLSVTLWKHEERIFTISSETAEFDPKTRDLTFVGHAMMDSGQNGRLLSHRIRWDCKTRLFRAGGPYLLTKNGEKREGSGIEVDYLFKRMNSQPAKG